MLSINDTREAAMGLIDKSLGLLFEAVGTFAGNERLQERGRLRQEAGDERLNALREEAKATARTAEARVAETRQRSRQGGGRRERAETPEPSLVEGSAEKVKGVAKQAVGALTGSEDLKEEGEAQSEKGSDQFQAGKHESRAELHRKRAEDHEEREQRIAR